MKVQTKRTLLFVSTIISVVSLFLSYYEIYRYIFIYICNLSRYINNYDNLEKLNDYVIVIESKEGHYEKIEKMLKSVLDQTVGVKEIIIYTTSKEYTNKLAKYSNLGIKIKDKSSYDYNDIEIYDAIKKYDNNTYVIRLVDDIIYGKDYISTLVDTAMENPNTAIIEGRNIVFKPNYFNTNIDSIKANENIFDYLDVKTKKISYTFNYKAV